MALPAYISGLLKPAAYPHETQRVSLLETHISWVLLTGRYAYKVKKPVNLGFLDFSTADLRRHYCQRELELNRRLAAPLYLDVLPIVRTARGYRIGGQGTVVDHCLKMRQFDQACLLRQLLHTDAFDAYWMDELAESIARFHQRTKVVPGVDADMQLARHMQDNLAQAQAHIPAVISSSQYAQLSDGWRKVFDERRCALRQRQQADKIRDGHGDLHLGNIALLDGHPIPFDCIEFSDELRCIDVLNDVAFLVMDCDAEQRADLGLRFLSRYLEYTGDYAGLAVLPLYLCYRASVRGKVACILADEQAPNQRDWKDARAYYALAQRYLHTAQPKLYAIGGPSGSGKSHLALLGCGAERAIIIRSDATRMRLSARHPELERYGPEMHRRTYAAMFEAARSSLAAGFSVILDATFLHPDARAGLYALKQASGVPLHAYWLDIDTNRLKANIAARKKHGRDISEADIQVLEQQLRVSKPPTDGRWQRLHSAAFWPSATQAPTSQHTSGGDHEPS